MAPLLAFAVASLTAGLLAKANCGTCHTLSDAGTSGQIGPNLDQVQRDYETVRAKVENGGGVMPSFLRQLSERQIKDVATCVATHAG